MLAYATLSELPKRVQDTLPDHAQEIYKEAFNSTWDQYEDPEARYDDIDREEVAHREAWSAVKKNYYKGGDGRWHQY